MGAVDRVGGSWLSARRLRFVEAASFLPLVLLLGFAVFALLRGDSVDEDSVVFRFLLFAWPFASGVPALVIGIVTVVRRVRDELVVETGVVGLLCVYVGGWSLILGAAVLFDPLSSGWGGRLLFLGIVLTILSSLALAGSVVYRIVGHTNE